MASPRRPVRKPESRETRRSLTAPLWAIGIALVGYPLVRDATADRMVRNTYRNAESCACAYSPAQCSTNEEGKWVGPWYASNTDDRKPDDPGSGKYCGSGSSSGYHGGYSGLSSYGSGSRDTSPASGVEHGYRGGFGGSGRVRAAGS
jgi:hypothetical protein